MSDRWASGDSISRPWNVSLQRDNFGRLVFVQEHVGHMERYDGGTAHYRGKHNDLHETCN